MNQGPPEAEAGISKDAHLLDDVFKVIWEKARAAAELISGLREERRALSERLHELERASAERCRLLEKEIAGLRGDLAAREQELKRVRAEYGQLVNANGHHSFSDEEREILKTRIRELITKINSYL